ncbi:DUF4405 domain-containing protein [Paenibacillus massiliensis]|uniref:DUF4405 domain-containing protein n=1 Tax=Paenibacillus massiliensis TaxID=225917 RepID=UPI001F19B6CA|nr:DUF4405 domain-containing protein [Paenibacillus massiliensis]
MMLVRLSIDLVMTILMVVEMAYHFTGNMFHEIFGVSIFILFIIHNILNRKWYQSIFKGKMNIRRVLTITINLLLLVTMAVLIISAIPISRTVFAFIPIENGIIVRQIHTLAAYWGLILIALHIGMHWIMIIGAARKLTGITDKNKIRTIALRVFAVLIVVYGVQASLDRNVGPKLILYYTFDNWEQNSNQSGMKVLLDHLMIMGIYIAGTHYALKLIPKKKTTGKVLQKKQP